MMFGLFSLSCLHGSDVNECDSDPCMNSGICVKRGQQLQLQLSRWI